MELKLQGSDKTSVKVSDAAFGQVYNEALVHQAVVSYLAGARAGTRAQKSRAEVRGGGKKPWRQKGSGRARQGSIRSPLWRGGGRVHAAKPRDHSLKLNRKMYRSAIRSIFSELAREDRLIVLEPFELERPKTKELVGHLRGHGLADVLLVTTGVGEVLALAARNLPGVDVCEVEEVNPVNLMAFEKVALTLPALKRLEEWLA